jgi:Tol biopolymer transport system component
MKSFVRHIVLVLIMLFISCAENPAEPEPEIKNETILFYTREMNSRFSSIYTVDLDGSNLSLIARDMCSYPIWFNDKNWILYLNHKNYELVFKDLSQPYAPDSVVQIHNNILFPHYSRLSQSIVFSHRPDRTSQIAKMDLNTFTVTHIDSSTYDRINPVCSQVDNWIYFSQYTGLSYDICRMYDDGSNFEPVLCDSVYEYKTFSVSADGELLVTPKYRICSNDNEYESYIVVFDLTTRSTCHEIPFTGEGIALYASVTRDKKYLLFVNGVPDKYLIPRNIYKIKIGGSDLTQITFFQDQLAIRPLAW